MNAILKTDSLPFCKGCGHDLIAKNTAKALERMGLAPLETIVVTDIGCHGIIDSCLNTHTVHGLHGRSTAIGAGIAMGLNNPDRKVIVFIGDGGSTIGIQHILEAARLNIDMTVVVHNNMLYGMTGGQSSGLTPCGFRTSTYGGGNPHSGYDICALTHVAGAAFTARTAGAGDFSPNLEEAFRVKGFSLVEVVEICPGYGTKFNPRRKLSEIIESSGKKEGKWENQRNPFKLTGEMRISDLLTATETIIPDFTSRLGAPVSMIISGSAGEGVQLAASLLMSAAVRSGCHATLKGSYPVTVGVGFSSAEIILSPKMIKFHGIGIPDIVIVTSSEGLAHARKKTESMNGGILLIDSSLNVPATGARIIGCDFRSIGPRSACIYALFKFAAVTDYVPLDSLHRTILESKLSEKVPVERIMEWIRIK